MVMSIINKEPIMYIPFAIINVAISYSVFLGVFFKYLIKKLEIIKLFKGFVSFMFFHMM